MEKAWSLWDVSAMETDKLQFESEEILLVFLLQWSTAEKGESRRI